MVVVGEVGRGVFEGDGVGGKGMMLWVMIFCCCFLFV